jgi:hypothetical protein
MLKGRVIWLSTGWFLTILSLFIISNLWFTRDTLSSYAPKETIVTIHLSLSTKEWTKLINDFGNLPLISGRPITMTDLAALKAKEIAIFVLSDNNSAIALRTKEGNINKEFLNSLGITLQKLNKNHWLLSNQPLPYSTEQKNSYSLGMVWPTALGTVKIGGFSGFLATTKNGYTLEIPKIKKTSAFLPNLPENTLAAVSIQPKSEIDFSAVFSQLNNFIGQFNRSSKLLDKKIRANGGIFLLTKEDFLLEANLDESIVSQILETSAFFHNLTEKPLSMPDNSEVKELIIDESLVDFASFWINNLEIKSAGGLLTTENEKNKIISSNQTLLEDYLQNKNKETKQLAYFEPKNIRNELLKIKKSVEKPKLLNFIFVFSQIYIEQEKMFFLY